MGLGAALTLIGGMILGMGVSRADTTVPGHGPGQMVSWSAYEGLWLGTYATSNGLAYCGSPVGSSPVGRSGSDPFAVSPGWVNDQGDAVSAQQLAQVAYIMWWFGPSPSDRNAGIARLAMLTVLGYTHVGIVGSGWSGYDFDVFVPGSDGQQIANNLGILGDVQWIVGEARAKASTWDGSAPALASNIDQISAPGDVIVASARFPGLPAGYAVTFTVTAPDGSTQNLQASTDGDGAARMSYQTSASVQGVYTVRYSIGDVPPPTPLAFQAGGPNPQTLYFAAPAPLGASGPVPGEVRVRFNPEVGTQASSTTVTAGDLLTDTVRSENLAPGLSWGLEGTLYGPTPAQSGSCEAVDWSAVPVATRFTRAIDPSEIGQDGQSVLRGLGPWEVPLTFEDQCVSYAEHLVGKDSSGTAVAEVDHPAGSPDQTALVEKLLPSMSSAISRTASLPGEVLTDTGVVTNVLLTVAGTVYEWTWTGTLYGPVAPGSSWESAPVATTWTRTISSADVAASRTATMGGMGRFTIPLNQPAGCYSYAGAVDVKGTDGSTYHADHPAGDPAQTTCAPNGVISVGTAISDLAPIAGSVATDSVHATGVVPSYDGQRMAWTLEGRLYGPLDPAEDGSCEGLDWSEAPVGDSFTYQVKNTDFTPEMTLDVDGLGAWTVPVDEGPMCLTYGETLKGVSEDGLTEVETVHAPGDARQTATVPEGRVTLASLATARRAVAGDTISDSWSMTGLIGSYEGSPVSWTISGTWHRAILPAGATTCDGVDWAGAEDMEGGGYSHALTADEIDEDRSATVAGVGETTIPPYDQTACYSSSGTLAGTTPAGWSFSVDHPVGDPSQTVAVIRHEITIGTQISDQTSKPGDTITDRVLATGVTPTIDGKPVSWSIHGRISASEPDLNGQCTALLEWPDVAYEFDVGIRPDQIREDGSLDLSGLGAYAVPALDPAHCLTYSEELTGTWAGGTVTVEHSPGGDSQTTLVENGRPKIQTQISSQTAMPSDVITDTAEISDLPARVDGKPVAWTVHGVLAETDPAGSCEDADWSAARALLEWDHPLDPHNVGTVTVSGMGAYTVPMGQPARCLSYSETLIGVWEGQSEPYEVDHPLGLEEQTALAAPGIVPRVDSGGESITRGFGWPLVGMGTAIVILCAVGTLLSRREDRKCRG